MNTLILPGDIRVAFSHLAAYGLAAIIKDSGAAEPRLVWDEGLDASVRLEQSVGWEEAAGLVLQHARLACRPESWVQAEGVNGGSKKGLFSPRVKTMESHELKKWYRDRASVLDREAVQESRLNLDFVGALGEPAYWASEKDSPRPDHGASRWEMKTRNRGEEFVANRLQLLAAAVASRTPEEIAEGLSGSTLKDEVGKDKADSRTPTGLTTPQATDNALAWCALWGLSLFPVIHQAQFRERAVPSRTAGHTGSASAGHLYLPVVMSSCSLPRLKSLLVSEALHTAAQVTRERKGSGQQTSAEAWAWLMSHGVSAVARFPVYRSNNPSAPEKWAQRGELLFGSHHG